MRASAMRQPPTPRGEWDPHDLAGKDKLGGYLEGRKIVCQRFRFAQHAALQNVQRKLVAPPLGPLGRMKPAGFRLVGLTGTHNTPPRVSSGASICRALAS